MSAAGRDQDLADGDALDVHAEDAPGDLLGLFGDAGQLDAAGLAAATHEDLRLDHDLPRPAREEPFGRGPRLGRRSGDLPRRDRQALGEQQRLRVGFLDLHARRLPAGGVDERLQRYGGRARPKVSFGRSGRRPGTRWYRERRSVGARLRPVEWAA